MTVALMSCMLITVASLFYIFAGGGELSGDVEKSRAAYLGERKNVVYGNLRDLNFEYRAGKIPDADYLSMKGSLQDGAATLLAEIGKLEASAARRKRETVNRSRTCIILHGTHDANLSSTFCALITQRQRNNRMENSQLSNLAVGGKTCADF